MKNLMSKIIAIVMSITLFTTGCSKKPEGVRIGYIPFNADLPFFVALEKGYFEEQGLKVDALRFGNSSQALNAMLAKQVDVVAGLAFSIFFAVEKESPGRFKLFVPFAEVESKVMSYLLVNKDSGITSLADLRGKRIGTRCGRTTKTSRRVCAQWQRNLSWTKTATLPMPGHPMLLTALSTGEMTMRI